MTTPTLSCEHLDGGAKRIGLTLFALVFGIFGLWAGFAPLDGAAFAPGTVTVKSYKAVQHLEGGIVSEILVRNGDLVESGQPLLILDATQPRASLEMVTSEFIALKARESRLIAERDGLETVDYPQSLNQANERVREEITAQNEIFAARKTTNDGRTGILERRVEQLRNQIIGMEAVRKTSKSLRIVS